MTKRPEQINKLNSIWSKNISEESTQKKAVPVDPDAVEIFDFTPEWNCGCNNPGCDSENPPDDENDQNDEDVSKFTP